jgi:hypothetical protein
MSESHTAHALYAPSKMQRIMACPGSVALEATLPDRSSSYADEGSAAHELAARAFRHKREPHFFLGEIIFIGDRQFKVDQDMADHVKTYMDAVKAYAQSGILEIEQRAPFGYLVGVPNEKAFGTTDARALLIAQSELQVHDLKYGMGEQVYAEGNEQMATYALCALGEYDLAYDIRRIRMVIHQPRLNWVDEWVIDVEELYDFRDRLREVLANLESGETDLPLVPGPKQCRFCKGSQQGACPALAAETRALVSGGVATADDFSDLTAVMLSEVSDLQLGGAMDKVGMIEAFCKGVRAEVEHRLLIGQPVSSPDGGYKIVAGRRGDREWDDAAQVETTMRAMRLKHEEMFAYKLKGPAPMEKLLAKAFPRRWTKLEKLIAPRREGKPSVALMSDPRAAITAAAIAEDFEDLGDEE